MLSHFLISDYLFVKSHLSDEFVPDKEGVSISSVFDGTSTSNWGKGKVTSIMVVKKGNRLGRYGHLEVLGYEVVPVDGTTVGTTSPKLIPQHRLVHEEDFCLFSEEQNDVRSRSRWRGVLNWVDLNEDGDMYIRYKGWYCYFDGTKYCWFDRLSKAMLAYDYHYCEVEPLIEGDHAILYCREDDYNFPYKMKCAMRDFY